MKALIIDDEKHVRDAIKILVEWDQFHIDTILEASDGIKAIEVIQEEQPEIIFTDMIMPLKNGVELLEWIHHHASSSKTIVISGHDDFDFVRHTVKYGGMDYILKPIDADQLHESLHNAVQSWNEEERNRDQHQKQNIEINQFKPVYLDKIFSNLIQEPQLYPSFSKQLENDLGMGVDTHQCQIAILSIETMSQALKDKYASNHDLLFFSLANIANEILNSSQLGYAFKYWNSEHELLIINWRKFETFHECISDINNSIFQILGGYFDFSIGPLKKFPGGMMDSYKDAKDTLKQRNLLERRNRIYNFSHKEVPRAQTLHFNSVENNILFAIRSSQPVQIRTAVEEWVNAIKQLNHITIEHLDLWRHEYTVFRSRLLKDVYSEDQETLDALHMGSDSFTIPLDEHGRLCTRQYQEEITASMIAISTLLSKHQQKENNVIFRIAEYIDHHYDEEISLKHISQHFFLSREYISRKFKQEIGENISDYIGLIRIDKAKLLLLNPQYKISQISEMVGYHDEKYFSKVFKKIEGISPKQYRKNNS